MMTKSKVDWFERIEAVLPPYDVYDYNDDEDERLSSLRIPFEFYTAQNSMVRGKIYDCSQSERRLVICLTVNKWGEGALYIYCGGEPDTYVLSIDDKGDIYALSPADDTVYPISDIIP